VMTSDFEPRILGFLCNWCSYAGADLAGVSRIQYPSNIRVIRVMCSGRVDPAFVIEGFLQGADGVMVLGCHPGECHYLRGNYEAINTANGVRKLLDYVGIKKERLFLGWVSASEGIRFSEIVGNFSAQLKELGPLGALEGNAGELRFKLEAAKRVVGSEKFRWILSKQTEFMEEGNKYGEKFTRQEMDRILESTIIETLIENKILLLLREKPLSVKKIAKKINLSPSQALSHVAGLKKKGAIALHSIEKTSPLYCLVSTEGGAK